MDDGKGVVYDAYSLQLLAVVASIHHEGVGQALDNRALGLAEAFYGIAAGGVREVDGVADVHVVAVEGVSVSEIFKLSIHPFIPFQLHILHLHPLRFPAPPSTTPVHPYTIPPSSPCNFLLPEIT